MLRSWSGRCVLPRTLVSIAFSIIMSSIRLLKALEVINEANSGRPQVSKIPPWPGITFKTDTAEGEALLGTPNGSGVAYMLIEHGEALGHKQVERIFVFDHDGLLMLLFHIVDVERKNSERTMTKQAQSVKQVDRTLAKHSNRLDPDADYEYESDEDED
ncbi:hypothetical protein DE146DRAFT_781153 [Phaeosphaeria sp. MPI-PUGE-AT-0046c]|nr:hypothetical protein DE146DRAFT_781153 [Phaeosphaeria sp. MPI-PUGE-AT-0046c]